MNTFKRKALFTAVLAGLGAAGTAEAVYLSPNNTGQALVYPYYTVQESEGNSWNTYISVVNTTTRAKAVKVRILEGKTSAEVLDFNLFLSPNDVWVAAIVPASSSSTAGGMLIEPADEASCTNPEIPAAGVAFRNFQYAVAGSVDAAIGSGLDRTREGYVEIIEMGELTGAWADAVTHDATGVPDDCSVVQVDTAPVSIEAPGGGLVGTGTLINVNNGMDATYKADALDAWSNVANYTEPGETTPNIGEASPPESIVIEGNGFNVTAYRSFFLDVVGGPTGGTQAVASVFMRSAVINEYVLEGATDSLTDWVLTQPLKRQFVDSTTAFSPYTEPLTTSGACEEIGFTYFDRDEQGAAAGGTDFSPLPPGAAANTLCWESNVLSIRNGADHMPTEADVSGVLGSLNTTSVNVTDTFQSGWARLTFDGANATTVGLVSDAVFSQQANLAPGPIGAPVAGANTFLGLPVTGFAVRTFKNGTLTCDAGACQGNYGGLFNHSYNTTITP